MQHLYMLQPYATLKPGRIIPRCAPLAEPRAVGICAGAPPQPRTVPAWSAGAARCARASARARASQCVRVRVCAVACARARMSWGCVRAWISDSRIQKRFTRLRNVAMGYIWHVATVHHVVAWSIYHVATCGRAAPENESYVATEPRPPEAPIHDCVRSRVSCGKKRDHRT